MSSYGLLKYSEIASHHHRLVVEVDGELARYYYSIIPKWIDVNKPYWPAHITVVRPFKEKVVNLRVWRKYEGEVIEFKYQNYLHSGQLYFWINVFCIRLEEIRAELGLSITSEFTRPPDGFSKCFHCTIANMKNQSPTLVKKE